MELGSSKKLNSELGKGFVPKTIGDFLQEVSVIEDGKKLVKLHEYVSELEKEMKKINVFKRELPVCMLLLGDAIDRLKEEVVRSSSKGRKGKEEEFSRSGDGGRGDEEMSGGDINEKKNWMSSAQLWTTPVEYDSNFDRVNNQDSSSVLYPNNNIKFQKKNREGEREGEGMGKEKTQIVQSWSGENRGGGGGGGAFVPFKKRCPKPASASATVNDNNDEYDVDDGNDFGGVDGLSLSPPVARVRYGYGSSGGSSSSFRPISQANTVPDHHNNHHHQQSQESLGSTQQQPKKQRRSWSPDLHRRFVNALEQLGGAQEATPKQIRELMQVADLTNDEVKSHLQKYRLHVRKMTNMSPGTTTAAGMDLNLDISGRELNNNSNNISQQKLKMVVQSGSPQGPLQLGGTGTGTGSSSKGISVSLTIGESLEDEEEEKSESHNSCCWKGRARSR